MKFSYTNFRIHNYQCLQLSLRDIDSVVNFADQGIENYYKYFVMEFLAEIEYYFIHSFGLVPFLDNRRYNHYFQYYNYRARSINWQILQRKIYQSYIGSGDSDSFSYAQKYQAIHDLDDAQLVSVPCSNLEILPNYATFQSQIETPLLSHISSLTNYTIFRFYPYAQCSWRFLL